MKKSLSRVIIVLVSCLIPSLVNAEACDYSAKARLNEAAGNVKVSYSLDKKEIIDEEVENTDLPPDEEDDHKSLVDFFKILIANVPDDLYITLTNKITGEQRTYYKSDAVDDVISFEYDDVSNITEYDIDIYSNNPNCKGELVRKMNLILPKFNEFSQTYDCINNPEFSLCKEFVTSDISFEDFENGINKYKNEHEETEETAPAKKENKIIAFYKKHALVINIIAGMAVVIGVVIVVILIKRKRSRIL